MALDREGKVVIWDLARDEAVPCPGPRLRVRSAAWDPQGHWLVLGFDDGVECHAFPRGGLVERLEVPGGASTLAFSRDGRLLAIGGNGARIWDRAAEGFVGATLEHPQSVLGVGFNMRGDLLVTACADGMARLFRSLPDGSSYQLIHRPFSNVAPVGQEEPFTPVFIDGDDGMLTLTDANALGWWNLETGQSARVLPGELIRNVAASAYGRHFVVCSKTAQLWDAGREQLVNTLPHGNVVAAAAFSPEGRVLLTGGYDRAVRFLAVRDGKRLAPPLAHQINVIDIVFSGDRTMFATAQEDGVVRAWKIADGFPEEYRIPFQANETFLVSSPDGRWIMPAGWSMEKVSKATRVYEVATGKPVGAPLEAPGFVNGGAFSPRGDTVVLLTSAATSKPVESLQDMRLNDSPGWIQFVNWRSGDRLFADIRMESEPLGAAFDGRGDQVAVVCAAGDGYLISAADGRIEKRLEHRGSASPGMMSRGFVRYSAATDSFLTWGLGNEVVVWDRVRGEPRCPPLEHADHCSNIDVSSDGKRVVTASWSKMATVWDIATGKRMAKPLEHPDAIFTARFSPDGRFVLTSCRDSMARLWDWRNGVLQCPAFKHDDEVFDAIFSRDGRWILTASRDGRFRAWEWNTGRPLTPSWEAGACSYQIIATGGGRYGVLGANDLALRVVDLERLFGADTTTRDFRSLCAFAEILCGQRIHDGGNVVNLTSAEWLERWMAFRSGYRSYFQLYVPVPANSSEQSGVTSASFKEPQPGDEDDQALKWLERLRSEGTARINCGGNEYREPGGGVWSSDRFYTYGSLYRSNIRDVPGPDLIAYSGEIESTENEELYRTERWFPDGGHIGQPNYRIPLPSGRYRVTLHFAEIFWRQRGHRVFDVSVEGELKLRDFEAATAGFATAVRKTFATKVVDGFLDIQLIPRKDNPQISAIEIERITKR